MRVLCRYSSMLGIEDPAKRAHVGKYVRQEDIGLEPGKTYLVYGVVFRDGVAWYYLLDDEDAPYPRPYCHNFFQLIDERIPTDWVLIPQTPAEIVPSRFLLLGSPWPQTQMLQAPSWKGPIWLRLRTPSECSPSLRSNGR